MTDKFIRQKTNKGAVLNVDNEALKAYKKRKEIIKENDDRLDKLEYEMSEIKRLLQQIIGKNK